MDRKLMITLSYLVLTLAALTAAGLLSPIWAPAAIVARLPQPAPMAPAERPQALSALAVDGAVALGPLAPGGMSGEFKDRLVADAGALRAPSVFVPSDRWWPGSPRMHGARSGHQLLPVQTATVVASVA